MQKNTEKVLLKDQLLNQKKVSRLSKILKIAYPKFDQKLFENDILTAFPNLELKERIYHIRKQIEKHFPKDYLKTLNILLESLKQEQKEKSEKEQEFIFAVYSDYVENNGCKEEFLNQSLDALGEFTKHCSAEFAIREFINNFPKQTFNKILEWSKSNNFHQRRLASEGFRPKLPWAKGINFDYKKATTILDNLFYDKERYVTRSVANHMNDLSKIDPIFTLEKLGQWKKSKKQEEKEMQYIIKHSLRTLIKKGHVETLKFLGHNHNANVKLANLQIKKDNIQLNNYLEFSFDLIANEDEELIVDYKIIYQTPYSKISSKVFKIKNVHLKKGTSINIEKKHLFQKMTTKKLYSGGHKLEIQVNGKVLDALEFHLKV